MSDVIVGPLLIIFEKSRTIRKVLAQRRWTTVKLFTKGNMVPRLQVAKLDGDSQQNFPVDII